MHLNSGCLAACGPVFIIHRSETLVETCFMPWCRLHCFFAPAALLPLSSSSPRYSGYITAHGVACVISCRCSGWRPVVALVVHAFEQRLSYRLRPCPWGILRNMRALACRAVVSHSRAFDHQRTIYRSRCRNFHVHRPLFIASFLFISSALASPF